MYQTSSLQMYIFKYITYTVSFNSNDIKYLIYKKFKTVYSAVHFNHISKTIVVIITFKFNNNCT